MTSPTQGQPSLKVGALRRLPEILVFSTYTSVLFIFFYRRGKDVNFDQLNSHASLAFDALNGHVSRDIPYGAGYGTLLPAFWSIPWWIASSRLADWQTGILLFAPSLLIMLGIKDISHSLFSGYHSRHRIDVLVFGCTLTSVSFLTEVGTTFGNLPSAIFILFSISVALRSMGAERAEFIACRFWAPMSGLLMGISVGLKWTNAIYLIALVAAFLAARVALKIITAFCISAGISALVVTAPWLYSSWTNYGSPIFPWYNNIFRSKYYSNTAPSDPRWAMSMGDLLRFPVRLAKGTSLTGEFLSRDVRIVCLLLISSIVAFDRLGSPKILQKPRLRRSSPTFMLSVFLMVGYLVWGIAFGVQRYFLIGELITGLLALKGAEFLVGTAKTTLRQPKSVLALLPIVLVATVSIPNYGHLSWSGGTWYEFAPSRLDLASVDTVILENNRVAYFSTLFDKNAQRIGLGSSPKAGFRLTSRVSNALRRGRSPVVVFISKQEDLISPLREIGYQFKSDCGTIKSSVELANWCRVEAIK